MTKQTYGSELAKMREKAHLTQSGVAKTLRLSSAQFISNWERGSAKLPVRVIPSLSKALKVTPETLVNLVTADFKKSTMAAIKKPAKKVKATATKKAKAKPKKATKKKAKKK